MPPGAGALGVVHGMWCMRLGGGGGVDPPGSRLSSGVGHETEKGKETKQAVSHPGTIRPICWGRHSPTMQLFPQGWVGNR